MGFTAEQFEGIVSTLRSDRLPGRRTHPRVGLHVRLRIVPCVAGGRARPVDVWLRDLSISGIGLAARAAMPVGSYFIAPLPATGGQALTVLFRVVHCARPSGGIVQIGAEVDRVLSEDMLHTPAEPAPAAHLRATS